MGIERSAFQNMIIININSGSTALNGRPHVPAVISGQTEI